jgi:hypothetical protein
LRGHVGRWRGLPCKCTAGCKDLPIAYPIASDRNQHAAPAGGRSREALGIRWEGLRPPERLYSRVTGQGRGKASGSGQTSAVNSTLYSTPGIDATAQFQPVIANR